MKHEITGMGIFNIQVCSEGTEDEALEWVRKNSPAGTTNNWQKQDNEKLKPADCPETGGRKHYLFVCN